LFQWIVPTGWRDLPAGVTATSATSAVGRRLRFVHNWSWEPARLDLPAAVRDLLGGTEHEAGEKLELGPWDVRVLLETQATVA